MAGLFLINKKQMIRKFFNKKVHLFFNWVFKAELNSLRVQILKAKEAEESCMAYKQVFEDVLKGVDVSIDVHEPSSYYSKSWAVISLQGNGADYIKFVDLGHAEIRHIQGFLRQFERAKPHIKIDASPHASDFLRVPLRNRN